MSNYTSKGNDAEQGFINRGLDNESNVGYGYGGVSGFHPSKSEWLGYDNTTVGPTSDVVSRLVAQNGIQSNDPAAIAATEPFRVGRFIVKWVKAPPFFPDVAVKYLRWIFEDMVSEVSGVPENSIDKIEVQSGATHVTTTYPGIYHESGGNSVTLKVREFAGSPVRKFLDYWLSGISDRKTGVCHMYGFPGRAVLPNMAGSIIYILLGPKCRPEDFEFACMWHEILPYSEKKSHLNSGNIGDAGSGVDMDVEFSGRYDESQEINVLAAKIIEAYNLYGQNFFKQKLPSYLYDADFYGASAEDIMNQMSIDNTTRIAQGIANGAEVGYDSNTTTVEENIFGSAFPVLETTDTAGSFGAMGVLNNGSVDTITMAASETGE